MFCEWYSTLGLNVKKEMNDSVFNSDKRRVDNNK